MPAWPPYGVMKPPLPTTTTRQGLAKLLAKSMSNALINRRNQFCKRSPEQRSRVNGREWGYIKAGSTGPALLLLPGTLGRADIFWNQIEALHGQAQILALTYPASGGIAEWGEDIVALMDTHSIQSATVLGSSLGGYLAQYFAAIKPELVDNLIAANTLPSVDFLTNIPPYSADINAIPAADLMQGFSDGLTQWAVDEPHSAELVELLLAEVSGRIPTAELRARLNALKFGPELPKQPLPKARIFTVESQDDRLIPEPIRTAVREALDPHESFVFKHGSHFPYITHPERYTDMIRKILAL